MEGAGKIDHHLTFIVGLSTSTQKTQSQLQQTQSQLHHLTVIVHTGHHEDAGKPTAQVLPRKLTELPQSRLLNCLLSLPHFFPVILHSWKSEPMKSRHN